MSSIKQNRSILKMTELAILTAIIILFQFTGTAIKLTGLGAPISLVLIPIVLGAVLLGPAAGAWLGFVFGIITYIMGITGMDGFTFILFSEHPVLTCILCIAKAVLAGLFAGVVYRALREKHSVAALIAAAATAPVVNTGIFILGALTMSGTLSRNFVAEGSTVIYFLVVGCAGINFLLELALNLAVSPALLRIVSAVGARFKR